MRKEIIVVLVGMLLFATGFPVVGALNISQHKQNTLMYDSSDDWPMFHHDIARTGLTQVPTPYTNKLAWSFKTGGWVLGSPVIANGKVYVDSYDNSLYCLDTENGKKLWSFQTSDTMESTPVVYNGKVYVGAGDANLYCLDAEGNQNATTNVLWHFRTHGRIESSPAIFEEKVYVGSTDGKVYCVNATTGAQIWNYTTVGGVRSSPAIAYGCVYIGSMAGEYERPKGVIYCLNAETGAQLWNFSAQHWITSSPCVSNDRVYIGSYDGNIYCLDATPANDGVDEGLPDPPGTPYDRIWVRPTVSWVVSSPAVQGDRLYIGVIDEYSEPPEPWGIVYCLNATDGSKIWEFYNYIGWFVGAPAISDGKVFIGSDWTPGVFYCLDARTGREVWNYTTGSWIYSSPAITSGKVYIGSSTGSVYCFSDNGIKPQFEIGEIQGGKRVSTSVMNTGTVAAHDVEVNVSMKGGILKRVNVSLLQSVQELEIDETKVVQTQKPFFGLGKVTIRIEVTAPGLQPITKTAKGFIIGFIVVGIQQ